MFQFLFEPDPFDSYAALDTGDLPRAFKEQVAFKVARLRGTVYCTGSHRSYARKHGFSAEQLDAIDRGDYSGLDARDVASLQVAEAMVSSRKGIPDDVFADLRSCFTPAEIVGLISLVGIMELACSMAEVFGLEAD